MRRYKASSTSTCMCSTRSPPHPPMASPISQREILSLLPRVFFFPFLPPSLPHISVGTRRCRPCAGPAKRLRWSIESYRSHTVYTGPDAGRHKLYSRPWSPFLCVWREPEKGSAVRRSGGFTFGRSGDKTCFVLCCAVLCGGGRGAGGCSVK